MVHCLRELTVDFISGGYVPVVENISFYDCDDLHISWIISLFFYKHFGLKTLTIRRTTWN